MHETVSETAAIKHFKLRAPWPMTMAANLKTEPYGGRAPMNRLLSRIADGARRSLLLPAYRQA